MDRPATIKMWWDGLEWQAKEVPELDINYSCNSNSWSFVEEMFEEGLCLADTGAYMIMDTFKLEWLYKFISDAGDQIKTGFITEVNNISDLLNTVIFLFI